MTEEVAVKRGRGRPRKVAAEAPVSVAESVELTPIEKVGVQAQIAAQMKVLMELATSQGLDLSAMFAAPPNTVTREVYRPSVAGEEEIVPGMPVDRKGVKEFPRLKLDKSDTVTFVPELIPSLYYPISDEDGRQKLLIDANDHQCWLTVNVPNTVNKFFYQAYRDAVDLHRELENLKRFGPKNAPWGTVASDGRKNWSFKAAAATFGMNVDGHFLNTPGLTADPE